MRDIRREHTTNDVTQNVANEEVDDAIVVLSQLRLRHRKQELRGGQARKILFPSRFGSFAAKTRRKRYAEGERPPRHPTST